MLLSLKSLFRARRHQPGQQRLYGEIVRQARRPEFYGRLGVPDTPLGRFSMLSLHGFLVMERLARDRSSAALAQALFDEMVSDMDRSLREMGVGDLSVGKKVKELVRYFYGMAAACREGLAADDGVLAAALSRNLHGEATPEPAALRELVAYVRASSAALERQSTGELLSERPAFAGLGEEEVNVNAG